MRRNLYCGSIISASKSCVSHTRSRLHTGHQGSYTFGFCPWESAQSVICKSLFLQARACELDGSFLMAGRLPSGSGDCLVHSPPPRSSSGGAGRSEAAPERTPGATLVRGVLAMLRALPSPFPSQAHARADCAPPSFDAPCSSEPFPHHSHLAGVSSGERGGAPLLTSAMLRSAPDRRRPRKSRKKSASSSSRAGRCANSNHP